MEDDLGLQLAFEEGTSKYFPTSNSAKEVRDRLLAACLQFGAKIHYNASLEGIHPHESGWSCQLSNQRKVEGKAVVSSAK